MPVNDYMGIEGFCVDAHSVEDVHEALDRLHTQILDEQLTIRELKRSPNILAKKSEDLGKVMRVLERAMRELEEIQDGNQCKDV